MASYAMHGRRRLALLLALASLLCPDALRPTFLVPTGALRPSARPARQIGVRHARPARMPAPDGAEDGELRSALSLASDCLGGGDDAGAARALMPHMGALLNANFGAVTEHVDELTREFVLVLVEEFVREATQLDLKRRRTLKSIVETALKDADGVDATLLKLREEVADAALVLQLVDEEIAKLQNAPNQEMRLIDFFQALRLRLMDELGAAVYGDAARALRFVLSCDTAADRDAALLQALGACETREEKQAFHHVLASTRLDLALRPDADLNLVEALDALLGIVDAAMV